VWRAVSTLLTDPESLRRDLEALIERERETHGDPKPEAKAWAATLSEVERKRDRYQEMFAADAMTWRSSDLSSTLSKRRARLLGASLRPYRVGAKAWRPWSETRTGSSSPILRSPPRRWLTWTLRSAARYTLCLAFVSKRCRIRA